MAQYIIEDTTLADIADAIRGKTGKSAAMTPLEMPEEITNIPTGSGTETKVLLWTNDAPATIAAFVATLSESMDNFDYLEIEAGYNSTSTKKTTIRFPVFNADGEYTYLPLNSSYQSRLKGSITIYDGSSKSFSRRFTQDSSTTIQFQQCQQIGGTGTSNAGAIPLNIYGIKIVHVPTRKTAIGTFSHGTSRTTVDIGFKPVFLCVRTGSGQSAISTYDAATSTTQAMYSGGSTESTKYTMSSDTTNYRLHSITDTGFTINKGTSTYTGHYFAIGEEE